MLKLFRYKNLIFTALIQILIYFSVILPILNKFGINAIMPIWIFGLIVIATVLIAAGGYVVNDYFDVKIDRINRPQNVVVGENISRSQTMTLYAVITTIGFGIGLFASIYLKNITLGFVFVIVVGMLWFYSSSYKRQFLVGNIIVALCAALVVILPLIAESGLQKAFYGDLILETPILKELYLWCCGFALFAFVFTLIREILKDIEDIVGDREVESRTLPIVLGETKAKIVVSVVLSLALLSLFVLSNNIAIADSSNLTFRYFLIGIFVPSIVVIYFLWKQPKDNIKNASNMLKFVMLIGILYSVVFYYLLAKLYNLTMFGLFKIV